MEVSGQSHVPADSPPPPPEKQPSARIQQEAVWVPYRIWTFCIRENPLAPAGVRILDGTARSLGVLLTELPRLPWPLMIL
jgi:hypothetical protein